MGFFAKLLESYHEAVNRMFSNYGAYVAHRPFIPLLIGIIILGSFCIGLVNVEKETDLELLWVEQNSRIIPEKKYFDEHFGGIPRKESVTINAKSSLDDALPDYGHAMDALTKAIKPLYNLTQVVQVDGGTFELNQGDYCERPTVPSTLRKGPAQRDNYLAWGYRNVSACVLDLLVFFPDFNRSLYGLPADWGFDSFPCFKLSPMDCFKEGRDVDYPQELQQLEQLVVFNNTAAPLGLVVYFAESQIQDYHCVNNLQATLEKSGSYTGEETEQIVLDVKVAVAAFATWGYNWRQSYKEMTSQEILSFFNGAINIAKNAGTNILDPPVVHCILEQQPCCLSWFGSHTPISAAFGSVEHDTSGNISKIGALRWGANNFHHKHPLWSELLAQKLNQSLEPSARKELVVQFENLMIQQLTPFRDSKAQTDFAPGKQFGDLQVQFTMWRSAEDVLIDANETPIWQMILSAALVSLYSFLAFVNFKKPVHSHTTLVLTGLTVVALAVVSGYGLTAAVGIKLSPLAGSVVPFLTLGLGIDDVFVLVTILRNFLKDKSIQSLSDSLIPEHEMSLTTALAGPSVVLTTFSVLASFFISSISPMPIVRWFCWQMGITATIHTLGMLLIFVPLMALDARRVKSQINDPYLWIFFGWQGEKTLQVQGKNIDGSDPSMQDSAASTPISRSVAKYYAPLFESNLFKVFVVILFAGLLGSMTYLGFWKVEHGLKLSEVTLKGSYQHDFAVTTEDRFPSYDIWLVTRDNIDYPNSQEQLGKLFDAAQQNLSHWTPAQPKIWELSWLGNLYLSMNQSLNLSYPLPSKDFYNLTKAWSSSLLGRFSLQDLSCYNTSTGQHTSCLAQQNLPDWALKATKTVLFAENLGAETKPNLDIIRETRRFADNFNEEYFNGTNAVYAYGYPFLFYEQYLHSSHDLYMVVGFALVGVFLAVLIFQFSLSTSLIIALVLLMVDIEVYGFLYIIGAKLNSLSLVNLGIVVGMASEFTYLARSFLVVDGTRNYRVGKALEWTFEPLLHGFGTQVAATLPLLFLKYHAFRLYYFAMFTIMGVLGFLNGFVLLPVLLSWLGPPPLPHATATAAAERELAMAPSTKSKQYAGNIENGKDDSDEDSSAVKSLTHSQHFNGGVVSPS
ncbi:hypothetical protein GOP47_0011419 [Adiantum capillus-veneris]|uniref:SSD domain-containing protein n=1 Tax=Adiantum capillus-veneris TaxID=13818 RepID=A0A9D4ZHU7_ADICA|nr:hypothetical protein GOP47_0011419 [Adiantum capillus-veneris]